MRANLRCELADSGPVECLNNAGGRHGRTSLARGDARDGGKNLLRELLVDGAEINVRIYHRDRMVLEEVATEVLLVPRDYGFDLSCYCGRHVHVVIRIWAVDR